MVLGDAVGMMLLPLLLLRIYLSYLLFSVTSYFITGQVVNQSLGDNLKRALENLERKMENIKTMLRINFKKRFPDNDHSFTVLKDAFF